MNELVKKFDKYERHGAYHWDEYITGKRGYKERVDKIVSYFGETGYSFLDIGCGDGLITCKLNQTKRFANVVGIDNNLRAIELANIKSKVLADTKNLFFAHKAFTGLNRNVYYDYILAHEVIEHVPNPEVLLSIINGLMRKFAIITTPNKSYNKPDKYDHNMWTRKEFQELLAPYKYEFLSKGKFMCVKLVK